MQFLVVTTLALASFLPTVIAARSAIPKCVPNSKNFDTLSKNFTLRVLFKDDQGRFDLKVSKPVVFGLFPILAGLYDTDLLAGSAKARAEVFELKNNIVLSKSEEDDNYDSPLGLESPSVDAFFDGPRTIILVGNLFDGPIKFTAIQACDRYGRGFLRLGQDRDLNPFIIRDSVREGQILLTPPDYTPTAIDKNITIAIRYTD